MFTTWTQWTYNHLKCFTPLLATKKYMTFSILFSFSVWIFFVKSVRTVKSLSLYQFCFACSITISYRAAHTCVCLAPWICLACSKALASNKNLIKFLTLSISMISSDRFCIQFSFVQQFVSRFIAYDTLLQCYHIPSTHSFTHLIGFLAFYVLLQIWTVAIFWLIQLIHLVQHNFHPEQEVF